MKRLSQSIRVQSLVSRVLRNRYVPGRIREKRYLNIGCGKFTRPEFINVDWRWSPGIDLCWDITRTLPLRDASLDGVYTEHTIEHFTLAQADRILAECFRVLRPGGCIRVIVPDGEAYARDYVRSVDVNGVVTGKAQHSYHGQHTAIMLVNHIMRAHGHQFIYDFAAMNMVLMHAGFFEISRQAFRVGRDPVMLIDRDERAESSLVVEAVK